MPEGPCPRFRPLRASARLPLGKEEIVMTLASFLRAACFALPAAILHPAPAQQPNVGDAAPPLDLAGWLNVEAGKEPKLEALKGSVVMLEFWGTWCGPCVRAMPEVQKLHDRYRDRGLVVLAISY